MAITVGNTLINRRHRLAGLLPLLVPLGACTAPRAPAFAAVGAFFPAWLACALLGVVGAVLVRLVFIRLGIDDALPLRLVVYVALALGIAFALSIFVFGR